MKRWLIISLIIVLMGFIIFFNHEPKTNQPQDYSMGSSNSTESSIQNNQNCVVEFTEYLIDPNYVQKLGQIGVVHGFGKSIVERSYISIKEEFRSDDIKIPIYAPTDITLISGSRYKMPGSPDGYIPDYALKFDAGCSIEMVLGHLKDVVPVIAEQINEIKQDSREEQITPIHFKAGDLIAYYIQQEQEGSVAGFDFITRNKKITNKFLNQPRYDAGQSDNLRTGVCPYDFYIEEKKQAYYNLFGGGGGTIFKNDKTCGSASRDVAGTISGMWFLDKEVVGSIYDYYADGDYGSPISIVGDEERIAIGHLGQEAPVIYIYSSNPTYRLPIEITDQHCYQIYQTFDQSRADGYVYLKVIDEMTMDVHYGASGICPSSMPSDVRRYYK